MIDIKLTGSSDELAEIKKRYKALKSYGDTLLTFDLKAKDTANLAMLIQNSYPNINVEITDILLDKNDDVILEKGMPEKTISKDVAFSTLKNFLLLHLYPVWEKRSMEIAYYSFKYFQDHEKELGKPAFDFSDKEAKAVLLDYLKLNKGIYSAVGVVRVLREYSTMYNKDKDNVWNQYRKIKNLVEITGEAVTRKNITKQNLIDLFDAQGDPQTYIVPLLCFEGLEMSIRKDPDEVRGLTKSAVGNKTIFIPTTEAEKENKSTLKRSDRTISIDEDVYTRLLDAMNQSSMSGVGKTAANTVALAQTKYVLRPIARTDNLEEGFMSYVGCLRRLNMAVAAAERLFEGLEDLTPTFIANCGKAHYVKHFMEAGLSEDEAIVATLKRFGDWGSAENLFGEKREAAERNDATNISRFNRLKKSYRIYM